MTNVSTGAYYDRMTYYQNDAVKGVQYGNGLVGNYTYDSLGRDLAMTLKNGVATKMSLVYGYNSTGTVAGVTGQVNSVNATEGYRYDILNRLISANVADSGTTTSLSYAYDALGNRLSQSSNGIAIPDYYVELLGDAKFTTYIYRTRQIDTLIEASANEGRPLYLSMPKIPSLTLEDRIAGTVFRYAAEPNDRFAL